MSSIQLARGTDAIELLDFSSNNECLIEAGGWHLDPITTLDALGQRKLVIDLLIRAPKIGGYWDKAHAIQLKLEQAQASAAPGDFYNGVPVTLAVQWVDGEDTIFFDVQRGMLDKKVEVSAVDTWSRFMLTLYILPYGRAQSATVSSATLTNGTDGNLFIGGVPGDCDALASIRLTDASTGGVVINSVQLGRRNIPGYGLQNGDFTPLIRPVAPYPSVWYIWLTGMISGSYTLAFNGSTTAAIAYNASAATVQSALVALASIGAGNVIVTGVTGGAGVAGGPYTVTFAGTLASAVQPPLTTATVNNSTYQLTISNGPPTDGTFTLSYGGQITTPIAWNATSAVVQSALQALSTVGAGNMLVTGADLPNSVQTITAAGAFLNKLTTEITRGNNSLVGGGSGGSSPSVTRLTYGGVPSVLSATGRTLTDATALGGSTIRVSEIAAPVQAAALFTMPVTGSQQYGRFDCYLRVRDTSGPTSGTPINVDTVLTPGGVVPIGTVTVQITAIDADGTESLPSPAVTLYGGSGNQSILTTWTPVGNPISYRAYYLVGSSPAFYQVERAPSVSNQLNGVNTLPDATGVQTSGRPPASSSRAHTSLFALPAIQTLNTAEATYLDTPAAYPAIGIGAWEDVYVGRPPLPPAKQEEGATAPPPWQVLVKVNSNQPGAFTTPKTIDIDGLWRFPAHEEQLTAYASGRALTIAGLTWVLDTDRNMRASGWLTDGGGNQRGQLSVQGRFSLGTGNNIVCARVEVAGAVSNVVDAKFTLSVTYTPRYAFPAGWVR